MDKLIVPGTAGMPKQLCIELGQMDPSLDTKWTLGDISVYVEIYSVSYLFTEISFPTPLACRKTGASCMNRSSSLKNSLKYIYVCHGSLALHPTPPLGPPCPPHTTTTQFGLHQG